jgi:hypothetical protein
MASATAAASASGAADTTSAADFCARHGFSPMPGGDASGESLVWRDAASV